MKKLFIMLSLLVVGVCCFAEGTLTSFQRRKLKINISYYSPSAVKFEYGMSLEEGMRKGRFPYLETDDVEEAKDFFEWLPEYLEFSPDTTKRFFDECGEDFDYIAAAKEVSDLSIKVLMTKYERGRRWAAFDSSGFIRNLSGTLQRTGNNLQRVGNAYMQ